MASRTSNPWATASLCVFRLLVVAATSACGVQVSPAGRRDAGTHRGDSSIREERDSGPDALIMPADAGNDLGSDAGSVVGAEPVRLVYAIHTHVEGDFRPYADMRMLLVDATVADNMIAAIEGIAEVLDRHGAKGTWEVVQGTARGICGYQGADHVFRRLQAAGHEIALHAHGNDDIVPVYEALTEHCGITPVTTSGMMAEARRARSEEAAVAVVAEALSIAAGLGMVYATENLSTWREEDDPNAIAASCGSVLGEGNDMWRETGNLMYPFRPDFARRMLCGDSPAGTVTLIDHVPITWKLLGGGAPDVLQPSNFDALVPLVDAAAAYPATHPDSRATTWGFVTHINEYAVGSQGESPPEASALAALDGFLSYVDGLRDAGLVTYATASEVGAAATR